MPSARAGVITYSDRSIYLGVYWFLMGAVLLGIAAYVWTTRTPVDPWSFIVLFGFFGAAVFSIGFWSLLRYQQVELLTGKGLGRWTVRFDLRSRRREFPLDEIDIVRCRLRAAKGRVSTRYGVAVIARGNCLPLASVRSEAEREKYLSEIPEELRPHIRDGEAIVSLHIRIM